ncbi:MAG: substrate-binding domain-containing protein [Verrucomicrobiales bacterium]|nr:substrate-binding domain-containing protein [Verrucomicrobiales bacterium]
MKGKTTTGLSLPHRCSLVAETVESLREGIMAGQWQDSLPGERVLSEQLQVGRTTLRTALKELEREGWLEVSQGKSRRIKKKVNGLDAREKEKVVSLISSSPLSGLNPSTLLLLDVLRRTLSRAGFSMRVHFDKACYSSKPSRALGKLVKNNPSSVWMLLYSKEQTERWFVRNKMPCLVMGSSRPGISLPSIDADHRAVCHHAGAVLVRKGHQRIALVLPKDVFGGDADSETGLKALVATVDGVRMQVLRHDGSADHLCKLVDRALNKKNAPTAFVVARAMHSLTLVVHLLHKGKRIPQDVAVISRDDDIFLDAIRPEITRYSNDAAAYARRVSAAARQLAETGILPANAIRLMPEFVAGETV